MFTNIVLFIFLIDILITATLYVLIQFIVRPVKWQNRLISIFIITFGLLVLCAIILLICAIVSIGQIIFI